MRRIWWLLFAALFVLCGCSEPEKLVILSTEETVAWDVSEETTCETIRKERKDILLIGDFRVGELRGYGCFPQSDFVCDPLMTVFNVWDSDAPFVLAQKEYECVVIGLGLNEAGYPASGLKKAFQDWITYVLQTQPQALIVLHGVLPVGENQAKQASYTRPERLQEINRMMNQLAQENRMVFTDFYDSFGDSEGYLLEKYSLNGCHLNEQGTRHWYGLLWEAINGRDRN